MGLVFLPCARTLLLRPPKKAGCRIILAAHSRAAGLVLLGVSIKPKAAWGQCHPRAGDSPMLSLQLSSCSLQLCCLPGAACEPPESCTSSCSATSCARP